MRLVTMILSIVVAVAALLLAAPPADAQSCQQLWVERNSYYKRHGYCFKSARAISYFGNGGCFIKDEGRLQLSPAERARIAQIGHLERAYGCN